MYCVYEGKAMLAKMLTISIVITSSISVNPVLLRLSMGVP